MDNRGLPNFGFSSETLFSIYRFQTYEHINADEGQMLISNIKYTFIFVFSDSHCSVNQHVFERYHISLFLLHCALKCSKKINRGTYLTDRYYKWERQRLRRHRYIGRCYQDLTHKTCPAPDVLAIEHDIVAAGQIEPSWRNPNFGLPSSCVIYWYVASFI